MVRKRRIETFIYVALWIIVAGLYLLGELRKRFTLGEALFDWQVITRMASVFAPFVILFLVNNYLLIPRLLLRNRMKMYFCSVAVLLAAVLAYLFMDFIIHIDFNRLPVPAHHPQLRPLLPLPLFLDFTYGLLVVGGNLAIALMFQRFDDKLEHESLLKANAENELSYLKAQINPHFYMNMLNNIHGMIEIDPDKAQAMVIDMSHLMRYMLYDSSRPMLPLADEVRFMKNYLSLMRQRYPESKVTITAAFPSDTEMQGIQIPPLLFLVFIENAFKHGISYQDKSYVTISLETTGDILHFCCMNSRHDKPAPSGSAGIGLRNISQRLQLIYGKGAQLETGPHTGAYIVNLTIRTNEAKNFNH